MRAKARFRCALFYLRRRGDRAVRPRGYVLPGGLQHELKHLALASVLANSCISSRRASSARDSSRTPEDSSRVRFPCSGLRNLVLPVREGEFFLPFLHTFNGILDAG